MTGQNERLKKGALEDGASSSVRAAEPTGAEMRVAARALCAEPRPRCAVLSGSAEVLAYSMRRPSITSPAADACSVLRDKVFAMRECGAMPEWAMKHGLRRRA